MTHSKLKVGDRIRFTTMPGEGNSNYWMHKDTRRVFKRLIEKRTIVRIYEIDTTGRPWFAYRFRWRGRMEHHFLALGPGDEGSWVLVQSRRK